jgi:Ca-activated chloride channel family protein
MTDVARAVMISATLLWAGTASSSRPAQPTEGTLTVRDGRQLVDVPLRHTAVRIGIAGFLADVEIQQTFVNPYQRKIDAVYLFPLPTGAAVNQMVIEVGGRTIRGEIQRRAEAQRRYEKARRDGHVAALLTQERPNLFTQTVANLEPGGEVVVRLRYVQPLDYEAGSYELVFPMVAGPRYLPPSRRKPERDGTSPAPDPAVMPPVVPAGFRSSHEISVEARIDAGVPVLGISSPSHRIVVDRTRLSLASAETIPNRDFILRYKVAGARPELALLAHRSADATSGSFFLLAQPPENAAPADITPREMVFVVDTSSSMAGAPLAKAKEVVRRVLRAMGPDDTFQIIRFDDKAGALGDRPLANRPRNLEIAIGWLDRLHPGGGTEMTAGIAAALDFPHDPARLRIIAFLTDGYIGNEDEVLGLVSGRLGQSRLFSFGVGSAVNRYLLEEMARIGRGAVEMVRPEQDTAAAASKFCDRIARPLLTDVRIDWGGFEVTDQVPAAVPDLFLGQPLVVAGRYRRPGTAVVTVHARKAGQPVFFRLPVSLPERDEARPAVGSVWARARIAELSRRELRVGEGAPDAAALREQITALALEHNLMSAHTAFVAVDTAHVTAGGRATVVPVPVEVPQGVQQIGTLGMSYGRGAMGSYGAATAAGGTATATGTGLVIAAAPVLLAGRRARAPDVITGEAVVRGSLDRTLIKRVFDARYNQVRHCYDLELQKNHTLAGRLTLELTIGGEGGVIAAVISESNLASHAVGTCVTEAARRWTFPAAVGGGLTHIRYPYVFQRPRAQAQMHQPAEVKP